MKRPYRRCMRLSGAVCRSLKSKTSGLSPNPLEKRPGREQERQCMVARSTGSLGQRSVIKSRYCVPMRAKTAGPSSKHTPVPKRKPIHHGRVFLSAQEFRGNPPRRATFPIVGSQSWLRSWRNTGQRTTP
jgi:hypothetical protein